MLKLAKSPETLKFFLHPLTFQEPWSFHHPERSFLFLNTRDMENMDDLTSPLSQAPPCFLLRKPLSPQYCVTDKSRSSCRVMHPGGPLLQLSLCWNRSLHKPQQFLRKMKLIPPFLVSPSSTLHLDFWSFSRSFQSPSGILWCKGNCAVSAVKQPISPPAVGTGTELSLSWGPLSISFGSS